MSDRARMTNAPWAVVIGDDHGAQAPPAQYCSLHGRRTLFQESLQRALRIAPASQIMVTAAEACRFHWEPALWFIRPEHRFISGEPGMSWLTTAAAILAIAHKAPDSVVTLLPGGCFVSHEAILSEAVNRAISLLPLVPESVISLGMLDLDGGVDEDYLIPHKDERKFLQPLLGIARRPTPWIAHHLRAEGALVASRVVCSYARTLAAHVSWVWPGLASTLLEHLQASAPQRHDGGVRMKVPKGLPKAILRTRQWYPPALPQRALRVTACGWSGLRTARAVARVDAFLDPAAADLPMSRERSGSAILEQHLSP
ncbi:MAG TPA: hypothetical protein VK696_08665 [Steroidobacteraceae bacterium]|jgi:hypothetical protein|nr:hypothetical protein [Steroidobacteraceae bacterium]